MSESGRSPKQASSVGRYALVLAAAWTVVIVGLGAWSAHREMERGRELVRNEARAHSIKDQAFRFWAASHGRVYVPSDEHTPSNPYLAHLPGRDVETTAGEKLTLVNPAQMLRQRMEDYEELCGAKRRITSLKPLRPENAPDAWERAALESFEHGVTEAKQFAEIDGEPHLRLMRPIVVKQSCLKCHEQQGYQEGDIRGGVGVSVPAGPFLDHARAHIAFQSSALGMIWLLGLASLGFAARSIHGRVRERDRTEDALLEQKALLSCIIESTEDAVFIKDLEGRYLLANSADARHIGLPLTQVLGAMDSDLFPEEIAAEIRRADEQVIESGAPLTYEQTYPSPERKTLIYHINKYPRRDLDGTVTGVIGFARDITERKEAEEVLRKSEEKLRNIVEHSTNLFYSHTADHVLTYLSPRVRDFLDCEPEEAKIRWTEFATDHPVNQRGFELTQKAIDTGERQVPYELELAGKAGRKVWVEVHETPLVRDGKTIAIVGALTDITERRGAKEALRKSEALLKQMADTIEDVFWITNWEDHRTIFASLAYEKVWGRPRQQLYDSPSDWADAIHPEDQKRAWEAFVGLQHDQTYDEEYRIVRPDGTVLWVRDRGYPVRSKAGQVDRVVGIAQDVTDRKRTEEELARHRDHLEDLVEQRTQELEESREKLRQAEKLASVGTFAAGVAHEINNPVGAMVLAAEYALRVHDRPDGMQEVLKSLSDIIRDGRRSREIVQNVLRFSRQEPTDKCPCNLNEVVNRGSEVALLAHPGYQGLKFGLADDLPTVLMNSTRMEQVVANLVKNAIESRAAHGTVSVRTERAPDGVRIVVTDDGRGMTEQQRRQAFDPFFTTRQHQGGTGLGLSISHGIVSEHGGTINIASVKGRGTVVTVELPT